jgi:tetratricopeptide (TPR) repeat protein
VPFAEKVTGSGQSDNLARVAAALAAGGAIDEATTVATKIQDVHSREDTLAGLAGAAARQRDRRAAFAAMELLQTDWSRGNAVYLVTKAQLERHDFAGARETVERFTKVPARGDALARIALAQIGAGDVTGAKAMLADARAAAAPNASSNIVLVMALLGDFDGARVLAEKAASPIPRDSYLLTVAYDLAVTGRIADAMGIIDSMVSEAHRADSLLRVGKIQIDRGDLANAVVTLKNARISADKLPKISNGRLYLDIERAQIAAHDLLGAHETAQMLPDINRIRGLLALITAWKGSGDIAQAKALIVELRALLKERRGGAAAELLLAIAETQRNLGEVSASRESIEEARSTADGIPQFRSTWLAEIAKTQIRMADLTGAMRTAAEMRPDRNRVGVLVEIADALAAGGRLDDARATLEEARGLALGQLSAQGRFQSLASILRAALRLGAATYAMDIVDNLGSAKEQIWGLTAIARWAAGTKDGTECKDLGGVRICAQRQP